MIIPRARDVSGGPDTFCRWIAHLGTKPLGNKDEAEIYFYFSSSNQPLCEGSILRTNFLLKRSRGLQVITWTFKTLQDLTSALSSHALKPPLLCPCLAKKRTYLSVWPYSSCNLALLILQTLFRRQFLRKISPWALTPGFEAFRFAKLHRKAEKDGDVSLTQESVCPWLRFRWVWWRIRARPRDPLPVAFLRPIATHDRTNVLHWDRTFSGIQDWIPGSDVWASPRNEDTS